MCMVHCITCIVHCITCMLAASHYTALCGVLCAAHHTVWGTVCRTPALWLACGSLGLADRRKPASCSRPANCFFMLNSICRAHIHTMSMSVQALTCCHGTRPLVSALRGSCPNSIASQHPSLSACASPSSTTMWEGEDGVGRGGVSEGGHSVEGVEVTDLECVDNCNMVTPTLASEIPTHTVSFFSLVLWHSAQHVIAPSHPPLTCLHSPEARQRAP